VLIFGSFGVGDRDVMNALSRDEAKLIARDLLTSD